MTQGNGNFEVVKENLPVKWYFYSPDKLQNSDTDIISDNNEFKEEIKSSKFLVRKCESFGGWHSPGFFQDFNAQHNETYKINFWVINMGCEFRITLRIDEKTKGRSPNNTNEFICSSAKFHLFSMKLIK